MKEPWKKTHKGKVVITLNDEKTEPTEVELPVDLNWTDGSSSMPQCRLSVSKIIVLLSFIFLLGLSTYALWKVQELEDAMEEDRGFFNLFRHTLPPMLGGGERGDPVVMILEDKDELPKLLRGERAEALIGSSSQGKDDDLKSSESQNSLAEGRENKEEREKPVVKESSKKTENVKTVPIKTESQQEQTNNKEDSDEWIKPLVDTFDILGNHPIEDHFLHNVLSKLFLPENNYEIFELNNSNKREEKIPIKKIVKPQQRPLLPAPIENIIMKTLLPPMSSFKIFHINEQKQPIEQQMPIDEVMPMQPKNFLKQMLPPFESGLLRSLIGGGLPHPNNMKIIQLNDQNKPEQPMGQDEDMPKITIQSIKLKLLPLPLTQDEYIKKDPSPNSNFEVIRLNEPMHDQTNSEEQNLGPKLPMMPHNFNPLPIPVQDIIMKTLMPIKNFDIFPMNERVVDPLMMSENDQPKQMPSGPAQPGPERLAPLPIPFQDMMMKTFMPPHNSFDIPLHHMIANDNQEQQMSEQMPEETMPKKIVPVKTVKMMANSPPVFETLLKTVVPNFDAMQASPMMEEHEHEQHEHHEQQDQQEQQPQQQEQQQRDSSSAVQDTKEEPEEQDETKPEESPKAEDKAPVESTWEMPQMGVSIDRASN